MKSLLTKLSRQEEIIIFSLLGLILISSLILINSKLNSLKNDAFINFQSSKAYFQNMQILLLKEDQNKSYEQIDSQNLASTISSLARNKGLSIDRIQPVDDNSYIVTINNGEFVSLFGWMKDLDEQRSISVTKASIKRSTSNPSNKIRAQMVLSLTK